MSALYACRQLAYRPQCFAELCGEAPAADRWKAIREHLQAAFVKVTTVLPDTHPRQTHPGLPSLPWPYSTGPTC